MEVCSTMLSHRATEQLEEGFVSSLPCMAQSFSCFKAGWLPVPQVKEAVMPTGGSQTGLTGAELDARNDEMHPFTSWLWASSIPAAVGRWQQVWSCPLWIRGAHESSLKQWEEAEALYSLPVPVLPWTHCLWVGGQHWAVHCRVVLLASLQTPALSTGCMARASAEMFISSSVLEP